MKDEGESNYDEHRRTTDGRGDGLRPGEEGPRGTGPREGGPPPDRRHNGIEFLEKWKREPGGDAMKGR